MNTYRSIAGILAFGSLWGLLECVIGSADVAAGPVDHFPAGAVMAGLFGLGLMVSTRRLYGVAGMQLGMALVASVLRYWAPIGSCVICSAMAIVAEGVVFEMFMLVPALSLSNLRRPVEQASLGVIVGYSVYLAGYIFAQVTTPLAVGETVVWADLSRSISLGVGRGFFAAVLGGISLPVAMRADSLLVDVNRLRGAVYYPLSTGATAGCWCVFALLFL